MTSAAGAAEKDLDDGVFGVTPLNDQIVSSKAVIEGMDSVQFLMLNLHDARCSDMGIHLEIGLKWGCC
jgi:hypothetical protein